MRGASQIAAGIAKTMAAQKGTLPRGVQYSTRAWFGLRPRRERFCRNYYPSATRGTFRRTDWRAEKNDDGSITLTKYAVR